MYFLDIRATADMFAGKIWAEKIPEIFVARGTSALNDAKYWYIRGIFWQKTHVLSGTLTVFFWVVDVLVRSP